MNTEKPEKKRDGTKYDTTLNQVDESSHYGRILKEVGHNKSVLELGCSTGFLSEAMTNHQGCQVTGVEIDPECVAVARAKCKQAICADLDNCDLQKVLPKERFDVVVCADVLEHLRDPARLLRSLRQWLTEDGFVIASIPNIAHGSVRLAMLEGQFPYRPMGLLDDTHIKFFNRALIEELFESAGYKVTVVGRNRWSVLDTEVGDRLPETSAQSQLQLVDGDPECETYQFLVKATKYGANEALGTRQKMLSLSGFGPSSAPFDSASLPPVDCVIFESRNAIVEDRYSANFKSINYPPELLRFCVIDQSSSHLVASQSLDDSPPSFARLGFKNFRFVGNGKTDPNFRQVPLPLSNAGAGVHGTSTIMHDSSARTPDTGAGNHDNSAQTGATSTDSQATLPLRLKESLQSELVFLCDAHMYPTANCLLALALEHRKGGNDEAIEATAEIRASQANQSGEHTVGAILVPRAVLNTALGEVPRSQQLTLETIFKALRKIDAKVRQCQDAMFFYMGTPGGGTTISGSVAESAVLLEKEQEAAASMSLAVNRTLYLDLMEKCLLNLIYEDPFTDWQDRSTPQSFDPVKRQLGRDWPMVAHTMIGELRLRNLRDLMESVVRDNVPGDLIETGVWRGGACIYMRAILKSYGIKDRKVFVADSFEGLPPPNPEQYPADAGDRHHEFNELAISMEQVQANFSKYGLLDEQVVFLKGWFKDTLPTAPIEQLAILRLDGDMYESTMDGLNNLYHKVAPGGFIIADDYGLVHNCKRAIEDFRAQHGITAPLIDIDGCGVYWRKEAVHKESTPTAPVQNYVYAPLLPAVGDGPRPFFSVIVPIFNRLDYLEKCLNSILDQDPGPDAMEIIVQDDSSDLEIEAAVQKYGRNRVRYNRTSSRLGLYANTNDGLLQARGKWIHVLHDDDFVLPGFYDTLRNAIEPLPETVGVACCRYTTLYEGTDDTFVAPLLSKQAGLLENWLATIARENMLNIPAIVIRREVFEKIGVFAADLNYAGDWEFWIRSALHYQWWYQPENLARFIVHENRNSLTGAMSETGEAFTNIRVTLDRVSEFLPPSIVNDTIAAARVTFSKQFVTWASEHFEHGRKELAVKVATEATLINKKIASTAEFFRLMSQDDTGQLRRLAADSWGHRAKEKVGLGTGS